MGECFAYFKKRAVIRKMMLCDIHIFNVKRICIHIRKLTRVNKPTLTTFEIGSAIDAVVAIKLV